MNLSPLRKFSALALLSATAGFAADQSLEVTLGLMDLASNGFKSLKADMRKLAHTDVVDKDDVDSGTVLFKRSKPHDMHVRIDLKEPRQQTVTIGDGKLIFFSPLVNEAQSADLGKDRSLVDQFFLLGFGSTSAELKNAYTVTFGGPETVNGEKTTRIILVPKDKEMLTHIKRCELWISEKGITVQQKFFTGGKDYQLATYSHIVMNPSIPDSAVKLDLPKTVKITKLK